MILIIVLAYQTIIKRNTKTNCARYCRKRNTSTKDWIIWNDITPLPIFKDRKQVL